MAVGQAALTIYQGDDYAANITVMQADRMTPADLTGYTAQSQIRSSPQSSIAAAQFATSIAANIISIVLSHDATRALTSTSYVWDLQIIDASGWITTLLAGPVQITKEVTKIYNSTGRR
jgi:hypothetical protein